MVNIRLTIDADDPEAAKEIALACAEIIERRTGNLRVTNRPPEPPRLRLVDDTLTAGGARR